MEKKKVVSKNSKKTNWDQKTAEQKLETFSSMLDKAVLSYPSLIKRSFIAGIFTGLGATVGVTVVFLLLTFAFKILGTVPLIGFYVQQIGEQVDKVNPANKVK